MTVDTLPSAHRPLRPVFPAATARPADIAVTPRTAGRRLTLGRGQIFTIPRQSGILAIEVLGGVIWLTATPADQDILLHAGDRFQPGPNAPYVIEALADAEMLFCLENPDFLKR